MKRQGINILKLLACFPVAALPQGCNESFLSQINDRGEECTSRAWTLPDGTEFSAWIEEHEDPDAPTHLWCSLVDERAFFRIGKNGRWKPMTLQTIEDGDGFRTLQGSSFYLQPGVFEFEIRVELGSGSPEYFQGLRLINEG